MEHLIHTLGDISSPKFSNDIRNSRTHRLLSRIAITNEPCASARVVAAVVYKNDLIAFGTNENKTHPFQHKFGGDIMKIHLHAEINAIKNALKILSQKELSKSTLYITRIKYTNEKRKAITWGLAKPCEACRRAIVAFGIEKICYTKDNNEGYEFE